MTQMTMKTILALCVVGAVGQAPSPVAYTTAAPSAPAPAPSPVAFATTTAAATATTAAAAATTAAATGTTVSGTGTVAASTVTGYTHTVTLSVSLSNITGLTQSQLIAQLTAGVSSGAGAAGSNVQVTITLMKIKVSYSGFSSLDSATLTKIALAYANMTGTNASLVTAVQASGGRRLEETSASARRLASADCEAGVANTDGNAVGGAQTAAGTISDSAMSANLAHQGVTASVTGGSPSYSAESQVVVTGSSVADPQSAIQTSVATETGGSVQVAVTTNAVTAAPQTTVASSGTGTDDSGAMGLVAPTMALWAAMCALMMA